MTAYELADELLRDNTQLTVKAAYMLRQQADRIAELEKDLHMIQRHYDQLSTQTKPLSDEEIIEIFNQIWNDGGNTNGVMHRFARAIEERHGIK